MSSANVQSYLALWPNSLAESSSVGPSTENGPRSHEFRHDT